MKKEKREETILVDKYIAEDGKMFDNEEDCVKYEKEQSHVLKSIKHINYFWDNKYAKLVYLSNKEDFNNFTNLDDSHFWDENFSDHGSGWYIYLPAEKNSPYTTPNCLFNLVNHVKYIEFIFEEWKSKIEEKIGKKLNDLTDKK